MTEKLCSVSWHQNTYKIIVTKELWTHIHILNSNKMSSIIECGSLRENAYPPYSHTHTIHDLYVWITWSQVGGTLLEELGDVALFMEVPHWSCGVALRFQKLQAIVLCISCLLLEMRTLICCLLPLLLHHHGKLSETICPTKLSVRHFLGHDVLLQQQEIR